MLLKELLKKWMTVRSPVQINTVYFKEWVTATLSVTKQISYFNGKMAVI